MKFQARLGGAGENESGKVFADFLSARESAVENQLPTPLKDHFRGDIAGRQLGSIVGVGT